MQAMDHTDSEGFTRKKSISCAAIPYALTNLNYILNNVTLPVEIPALWNVLSKLGSSPQLKAFQKTPNKLKVRITSFAFKKGIPADTSGNGGGFVFDCRGILNPGRNEKFKMLNGRIRK
jgi:hypothetical protein